MSTGMVYGRWGPLKFSPASEGACSEAQPGSSTPGVHTSGAGLAASVYKPTDAWRYGSGEMPGVVARVVMRESRPSSSPGDQLDPDWCSISLKVIKPTSSSRKVLPREIWGWYCRRRSPGGGRQVGARCAPCCGGVARVNPHHRLACARRGCCTVVGVQPKPGNIGTPRSAQAQGRQNAQQFYARACENTRAAKFNRQQPERHRAA